MHCIALLSCIVIRLSKRKKFEDHVRRVGRWQHNVWVKVRERRVRGQGLGCRVQGCWVYESGTPKYRDQLQLVHRTGRTRKVGLQGYCSSSSRSKGTATTAAYCCSQEAAQPCNRRIIINPQRYHCLKWICTACVAQQQQLVDSW